MIFFLKQSFNGLIKNGIMSMTSVFVLMSCLVLMGCFTLVLVNIDVNMEAVDILNKVVVFISDDILTEEIQELQDQISNLSNVKSVDFISKQVALERWKADVGEVFIEFVEDLTDAENPIRNSFEIEYVDSALISNLIYQLENINGIEDIRDRSTVADNLNSIKNVVTFILIGFLIILFTVSTFIILNTIKLSVYSRRNEISIMRYIGATGTFILIPFILEGIIIGLAAGVGAYFLQWYIYRYIIESIIRTTSMLTFIQFSEIKNIILLSFVTAGILTGFIGSSFSSRKYLKA